MRLIQYLSGCLLLLSLAGCGGKPSVSKSVSNDDQSQIEIVLASISAGEQDRAYNVDPASSPLKVNIDASGYLDYETACNESLRGSIQPASNAVILLLKALGPTPEGSELPATFYKWLGVPASNATAADFQTLKVFYGDEFKANPRQFDITSQSPLLLDLWKATDNPKQAAWLKQNEAALAITMEASLRKDYYHPLVAPWINGQRQLLFSAPLAVSGKCRELAYALCQRATLRAGEGKWNEAWGDVFAAFRIARLVSRGGTELELIIGVATEDIATYTAMTLLSHDEITTDKLQSYRTRYEQLIPFGTLQPKFLVNICTFQEIVQSVERYGLGVLSNLENSISTNTKKQPIDRLLRATVDWNVPLARFKIAFEQFASIHALPSHPERVDGWQGFREENPSGSLSNVAEEIRGRTVEQMRPLVSERMAQIFVGKLMPNTTKASDGFYRNQQQQRNVSLMFAVLQYHVQHSRNPKTLEDLVPNDIASIPRDAFSTASVIYQLDEYRFSLYSVGANGIDDGFPMDNKNGVSDDFGCRITRKVIK